MARRTIHIALIAVWSFGSAGCVAVQQETGDRVQLGGPAKEPPPAAVDAFDSALLAFAELDARRQFSREKCTRVAEAFLQADALSGAGLPDARYDAGLAYRRCGMHAEARRAFESVLALSPHHGPARVELALDDLSRSGRVDEAIQTLDDVVKRARYQDAPALVKLASLRMQRNLARPNAEDAEAALKDVQRALAVDDAFMPAYNELAIMHLQRARAELGKVTTPALALASDVEAGRRTQSLDMAALVASQGLAKNASYAPLHNTAGLVAVELGELHTAVESFDRARKLSPSLLEASHNYAALSLMTRSFDRAERAYRDVLAVAPNDYEAHLGLSLALRAQATSPADAARLDAAERSLERAMKLAPERPEAYFNRAILTAELRAKTTDPNASLRMIERAACELNRFTARARDKSQYASALKRADERRRDMTDVLSFIHESRTDASRPLPVPLECR
jgi:tetratricopeptide (TPR) repeat protein